MIISRPLTVSASGTTTEWFHHPGYCLVGLLMPTVDSTTIKFDVSKDGTDPNALPVFTNSGAPAAVTLGSADIGGKAVAVPEEIGNFAAVAHMRLVVAAQASQRSIIALLKRREG